MARTPRDRLDRQKERIEELEQEGEISEEARDRLLKFADAVDEKKVRYTHTDKNGRKVKLAPRSIEGYIRAIRITIEEGLDLLNAETDDVNDKIHYMHDEQGKTKTTLGQYQAAFEHFYTYHDDLDVNPYEIEKYGERSDPKFDEQDMFTEKEVQALRNACSHTKNPVRNRAFLELSIFTGQRITSILTLRTTDIELHGQRGYIYLNEEYDNEHGGLKNALQRGRKRPIFGATKYVRDWLEHHPYYDAEDNPDTWLFVGHPSHWKTAKDDHWSRASADQRLRQIKKEAGVEKKVSSHAFRHYCATVLYRDYDLRKDTIRMLLGHAEGSSALEEIYSHIFEEDYIQRAEEEMGYREKEERNPFTPETCPTCGEILEEGDKACSNCGALFAPDAQQTEKEIEEDMWQSKGETDGEEEEALDKMKRLLSENPELIQELTD